MLNIELCKRFPGPCGQCSQTTGVQGNTLLPLDRIPIPLLYRSAECANVSGESGMVKGWAVWVRSGAVCMCVCVCVCVAPPA